MTSPFHMRFTRGLVAKLTATGQLDVEPGDEEEVAFFVARRLEDAGEGGQAISTLVQALLDCPEVEELYADDREIMSLMESPELLR